MSNSHCDPSEDEICDVCRDGECTDDNHILFCDSCDIAVHQGCYSVMEMPAEDEDWFCYPCARQFEPQRLSCALCAHIGGAYKSGATEATTWVHALCSNWIPELYEEANDEPTHGPLVHIEALDTARLKLRCALCNECGGAGVQCFYASCHKAVHPSCMLREPNDFTWRVVESPNKDGNPGFVRELFCPAHADRVGAALKRDTDMVIQIAPNAKFEIGSDFFPAAKPEFRDYPFGFKIGRTAGSNGSSYGHPTKGGRKSTGDASSNEPASKKRKRSTSAALMDPASPAAIQPPRGIPSKRPKATIVSAAAKPLEGLSSPLTLGRKKAPTSRGPSHKPLADNWSAFSINEIVDMMDMSNTRASKLTVSTGSEDEADVWGAQGSDDERDVYTLLPAIDQRGAKATPQHTLAAPPSPSPMSVFSEQPAGTLPPTGRKSSGSRSSGVNSSHDSTEDTPTRVTRLAARSGQAETNNGSSGRASGSAVTTDIQQSGSSRKVKTTPRLVPPGSSGSGLHLRNLSPGLNMSNADMSVLLSKLLTTLQHSFQTGVASPQSLASVLGPRSAGSAASDWFIDSPLVPRYRVGTSSLDPVQWAALQRAGWVCLTSIPPAGATRTQDSDEHCSPRNNSSRASEHCLEDEEVYLTPGTVEGSAGAFAGAFRKSQYIETIHYFGSAALLRAHLAQNPLLTQPWTLTWRSLQRDHGWRVVLTNAAYTGLSSHSAAEGLPVSCIFLSDVAAQTGSPETEGEDDDEDFVHRWRVQNGVIEAGEVEGNQVVGRLTERVHKFGSWRALQYYIHRFPYFLQDDANLVHTLQCHGWRHRLRIKAELRQSFASSRSPHSHSQSHGASGGASETEFLWESAHVFVDSADSLDEMLVDELEPTDGVWLTLPDLRRHLWVEPARLFRPYDRILHALRTTHMPATSQPSASRSSSSGGSNGSSGSGHLVDASSAVPDAAEVEAMREALARLHAELAQVKQKNVSAEQKSTRLEEELLHMKQRRREKKEKRKGEKEGGNGNQDDQAGEN